MDGSYLMAPSSSNKDNNRFSDVKYEGSLMFFGKGDDDFAGVVFSYVDRGHFYLVTWKKLKQRDYWHPERVTANAGIQMKLVNTSSSFGQEMRDALWSSQSTLQASVLWTDSKNTGWDYGRLYEWEITHLASTGLINLKISTEGGILAQTGDIYDSTLRGGRLGVFCFSQQEIIWMNLKARCIDSTNFMKMKVI
ncbi:hypothetical protein SK128_028189 [Halocaridina rubra]|uniref:TSP C-terminal domain-containing protein n=1 Tax=Halocaridina rubra TaxID=373956 RepID=A0AAN8ZXZ9_HALRR